MKTVFTIILFALFSIGVHAQSNKGMIKVSVMYPNAEGKSFDMDLSLIHI